MDRLIFLNIKHVRSWFILIIFLGLAPSFSAQEYSLSFQVLDEATNRPIENAQIIISPCACGGVTDANGEFSINLPKNTYAAQAFFIGYKTAERTVIVYQNRRIRLILTK